MIRVGHGYDLHKLKEGQGLYMGGLLVSCSYSAIAHSDGDVLCHAVIDSLLGALALGDIGTYFPPSEECWRNADSLKMLQYVYSNMVQSKGFYLVNLDCTVILEKVRLRLLIDDIRRRLLSAFESSGVVANQAEGQVGNLLPGLDQISVKAKTKEGVGAVGQGEAVEAYASCLLQRF